MSARTQIRDKLVELFKGIDGVSSPTPEAAPYRTNLYNNVIGSLIFWDEINDFPFVSVVPTSEAREYKPGQFKWGFLNFIIRVYVKEEDPAQLLEDTIYDIERVLDANIQVQYDATNAAAKTANINIVSIVTDEGLLAPIGVGEITAQVQYQVLSD